MCAAASDDSRVHARPVSHRGRRSAEHLGGAALPSQRCRRVTLLPCFDVNRRRPLPLDRWTRNPMYLGLVCLDLGAALVSGVPANAWSAVAFFCACATPPCPARRRSCVASLARPSTITRDEYHAGSPRSPFGFARSDAGLRRVEDTYVRDPHRKPASRPIVFAPSARGTRAESSVRSRPTGAATRLDFVFFRLPDVHAAHFPFPGETFSCFCGNRRVRTRYSPAEKYGRVSTCDTLCVSDSDYAPPLCAQRALLA